MSGIVFDIQKFASHDGPGIRTTVFLKGCPMRCLWCHNPESQEAGPEISFAPEKCVGCGECAELCPGHCANGKTFDRTRCARCGKCAEKCFAGAREKIGKSMPAEEVLAEVMKDKLFYETSGGGLTISGGEPMFQFDFTMELLKGAKKHGLHVCVETCGFAPSKHYEETLHYVDIHLFDFKESDPARHLKHTGAPLEPILENLDLLDSRNAPIILRCPLIPGLNTNRRHLQAIGALASRLDSIMRVDVEPYHPMGVLKSGCLGKIPPLPNLKEFPEKAAVASWVESIRSFCSKPVEIA